MSTTVLVVPQRRREKVTGRRTSLRVILVIMSVTCGIGIDYGIGAEQGDEMKTIRKPVAAALTDMQPLGVNAPEVCKDGDPTLVQCVPLGASMLAVCGPCPDSYTEIGRSNVPARCGGKDSGLLSQCQLQQEGADLARSQSRRGDVSSELRHRRLYRGRATPPPPKFRPAPETEVTICHQEALHV